MSSHGPSVQELASLREQLLAAESATAGAVKESSQLRHQLHSLQSKSQTQAKPSHHAELTRQVTPVIDQLLKETYTALRDEFQSDVMYKVGYTDRTAGVASSTCNQAPAAIKLNAAASILCVTLCCCLMLILLPHHSGMDTPSTRSQLV